MYSMVLESPRAPSSLRPDGPARVSSAKPRTPNTSGCSVPVNMAAVLNTESRAPHSVDEVARGAVSRTMATVQASGVRVKPFRPAGDTSTTRRDVEALSVKSVETSADETVEYGTAREDDAWRNRTWVRKM